MSAPSADSLVAAARELLRQHGPMDEDELLDALQAAGADLSPAFGRSLTDVLDDHREPVHALSDERLAWIPAVLDGRIFTHRLTPPEAEHDVIPWHPDLSPLCMLIEGSGLGQLTDGSPISEVFVELGEDFGDRAVPDTVDPGGGVLVLPSGRFAELGATAGDLVGLRLTAQGLELEKVTDIGPCAVEAGLTALLDEQPDRPEMLDVAVWTLCADDDGLFRRPAAPMGVLLAESGFACDGSWVAPGGFDFDDWRTAGRVRMIQERHDLSFDEAMGVLATVHLYDRALEMLDAAESGDADQVVNLVATHSAAPKAAPDRLSMGMALEFLAEPAVAAAVLDEIGYGDQREASALRFFAESLEPMAPRAARPALRWLQAKAFELLGDVAAAEATLEAAESLDPSWPLTLTSLARYASDRGDAERGLSLLRRAGIAEDHELVVLLQHFRPAARIGLGRNERCWCGSGRKYKVCHLNREQLPLQDRAAWLYQKSSSDLLDGPAADLVLEAAAERARYSDSPDALREALDDGLVYDAVLFEGGAFEDFLYLRGCLLPEDERLLAEQWLLAERSVHEVVAVRRGEGMTLRDVRTGDINEVRERAGSTQVKTGELYCARVLPAGERMQIFGGLHPVSVGERDALIALLDDEPDPVELVAFLSRRFAPPRMANTEGEPLMMCEATLRVEDPAGLAERLDDTYGPHEQQPDGTRMWLEHIVTDGLKRIRAQIEMNGDQVHVQANSAARFDRVLGVLRELAPSVVVLTETREPAHDVNAVERLAGRMPSGPAPALDPAQSPQIAAALDEFVRQYEASWLDEPIPALSGHTPRQCADDPTRRDDLIRLLDSFGPDTGVPGAMSPARLRAALGLD
jgi:tetratricopeptide (TPR) repeat protein